MTAITTAGESLIVSKLQSRKNIKIDKFVFANIPGLDHTVEVDRTQVMPVAAQIMDILDVTLASKVNNNTVVFSNTMGSDLGSWQFNWMGLYSSEDDVLVAVDYLPLQEKRGTVGSVPGNVITKNFALEFNGAPTVTGINIAAESWQLDFSARFISIDKSQRDSQKLTYGDVAYENDAFKIKYENSKYWLTSGRGVLSGLDFDIADLEVIPESLPKNIFIEVYQEPTMSGVVNTFDVIVTNDEVLENKTENSVEHVYIKLGVINSSANITDERVRILESLVLTDKATVTRQGPVKLSTTDETIAGNNEKVPTAAEVHALISSMFAGQVSYFPGTKIPSGWIKVNGQELSRSGYPYLWKYAKASGNISLDEGSKKPGQFGGGDGVSTFTLPDLRGQHLRAWDDGRGIDGSREIGSEQDDDIKQHNHEASSKSAGSHGHDASSGDAGGHKHTGVIDKAGAHSHSYNYTRGNNQGNQAVEMRQSDHHKNGVFVGATTGSGGSHEHTLSIDSAGSHSHAVSVANGGSHSHGVSVDKTGITENRVKNVALMVCIKY